MDNYEYYHHQPHQQRVKHIYESLVPQQIAIPTLEILDNTEYRSDQNQDARAIERPHMLHPWSCASVSERRRVAVDPSLEYERADDKEAEESDLHEETAHDDILPHLLRVCYEDPSS